MEPFTIELPADAGTPRLARRAVLERCAGIDRLDDLLLCVSEVVTNAVLHAGTPKRLSVRPVGDLLLVEVADGDPRLPAKRAHDLTSATGRGLHFLDDLTVQWGARPTADGKIVWFEFAPGDPRRAPAPVPEDEATAPGSPAESGAGGAVTVTVTAGREIDLLNATALRAQIEALVEAGTTHVIVDLSPCEFLDSTGISVLATVHLDLARRGGRLEVAGAHGAVASVLALSGVDELLAGGQP